jgi:hypothetical protein
MASTNKSLAQTHKSADEVRPTLRMWEHPHAEWTAELLSCRSAQLGETSAGNFPHPHRPGPPSVNGLRARAYCCRQLIANASIAASRVGS